MLKHALILGLLALGLSGGGHAQQSGQDVAAARALAKQEFAEVVRLYAPTDRAQLDDRALYRLAIAEFRLGNRSQAAAYLDRALKLNPKGSFASSPERLSAWQKEIGPVAPQSFPVSGQGGAVEVLAATEPAAAASEPEKAPDAPIAVASSPAPITVQLTASDSKGEIVDTPAGADLLRKAAEVVGFAREQDVMNLTPWAAGGVLLLVALIALRRWRSGKPARLERALHRKLFERLQEFRSEARQIHDAVQAAGRTDTDLYAALSVLLRALDGEIGRSYYFGKGREDLLVPADAETLEVIQRLRTGPMKLSSATGAQVKALFQTSQRAI